MLLPLPAAQHFNLAVFPLFNDVCYAKHTAAEFLGYVALNLLRPKLNNAHAERQVGSKSVCNDLNRIVSLGRS